MILGLAILTLVIVLYAAVAVKLGSWSITMPMVFVVVGFLLGSGGTGLLRISPETETVKVITEITLALLLFADASTLSLRQVEEDANVPARLLSIGLPLTILMGAGIALLLLRQEGLAFACLLGAILAPTDAALGLPIFNNPRVPVRIRRALNIESGLNDGIATPFVVLFLAFAAAMETATSSGWLRMALVEIAVAILSGALVGLVGGWVLAHTARKGWTSGGSEQIAIMGLALTAYLGSVAAGGNGFIAAFVGGIVFRAASRNDLVESTEFTETVGTCLSLLVWVIFGATLVTAVFDAPISWRHILYAALSLTAVRMLPVALALRGVGFRRDTVAIMGWFGPRGLASVVFTLMALEAFAEAGRPVDNLAIAATWTILLSVFLHGLSAVPVSGWYAKRLQSAAPPLAEMNETPELHQRRRALTVWANR